jgi:cysteine desulfurase
MSRPIYLDYAATAPLSEAARAAWLRYAPTVGNPSSLHGPGRAARVVVEESREQVADLLGAAPLEVIFTAGGTESDNLAVLGIARAQRVADPRRGRVVVSAVEHHAILGPAYHLAAEGFAVAELAVDRTGRVDLAAAQAVIEAEPDTIALVSCQWTNNENGALQPVAELAEVAHAYGIPVHSDAVQAVAYEPVRLRRGDGTTGPDLDALTVSAHKLGGPVGIGAFVARRDLPLTPVTWGGGQERRVRPGTLPVALIASFAVALVEAVEQRTTEAARVRALSDRLRTGLANLGGTVDTALVVGPTDPALRSPHIVHALFPGCLGDDLLLLLDAAGIACSTGSACSAGVPEASHVLLAMGYDEPTARSALRFSLGAATTAADIDALLATLPSAVARLQGATPWRA